MLETVEQKLEEILDKEAVIDDNRLSEKEICVFEKKFQIELPKEYRDFLTNNIEAYVRDAYQFPMLERTMITPKSGFEMIDYLYVGNFIINAEQYILDYGKEMIPIGEAGRDTICIGTQEDNYGKIYYSYHEDEESNYCLVSPSFNEFILSFEKKWKIVWI